MDSKSIMTSPCQPQPPVLHRASQRVARWLLRALGWRVEVCLPQAKKYVLVGAPHTSNWDFPVGLLAVWEIGFKVRWIGKHTLFRWPLGPLMRALGGIPVDRSARHRFADQMRVIFDRHDELVLLITPEGTRSRTEYWKSGFYYIALGAKVPIVLGYVDFPSKRLGIGPSFMPSGDIEADMRIIQAFYADKTGLRPQNQGDVRVQLPSELPSSPKPPT